MKDKQTSRELCLSNILNGLAEGLSKFSNPSRVAVIYKPAFRDPLQIFDPQNILKGHESRIKEVYLENYQEWKQSIVDCIEKQPKGFLIPVDELSLAGLISYGACGESFFYQMWLTDHHPDICSVEPTRKWLEHAACLLSSDYYSDRVIINSSGYVLKNYSLQAIADHIVDRKDQLLFCTSTMLIPPILNTILDISKTREEGALPKGDIFFIDPDTVRHVSFLTKIQRHEQPVLTSVKHIRKLLLAVEDSNRKLVSDGCTIIGITDMTVPDHAVSAEFKGDHGFLKMGSELVCSFCDGNFHSTTRRAKMVELEELLLDSQLSTENSTILFQIISELVHNAEMNRHGCTLVIDLNETPLKLTGHVLDPPLNLLEPNHIDLACSLTKIDGALHINRNLFINGFACLLDGKTTNWENLARGARYNSALRFSCEHDDVIVVVVSADRPVSIIYCGIEMSAYSVWKPIHGYMPVPVPLKTYLNGVIK